MLDQLMPGMRLVYAGFHSAWQVFMEHAEFDHLLVLFVSPTFAQLPDPKHMFPLHAFVFSSTELHLHSTGCGMELCGRSFPSPTFPGSLPHWVQFHRSPQPCSLSGSEWLSLQGLGLQSRRPEWKPKPSQHTLLIFFLTGIQSGTGSHPKMKPLASYTRLRYTFTTGKFFLYYLISHD